jgi:proline iminopeptidase
VIYYEQRGCGRSDKPLDEKAYSISILTSDIEKLCVTLKIDKIIPLGFSFGGQLALEFALRYPAYVEKMILHAPTEFFDNTRNYSVQINGFEYVSQGEVKNQINKIIKSDESVEFKWMKVWNAADSETKDRFYFHQQAVAREFRRIWKENKAISSGVMSGSLLQQKNDIRLLDRVFKIKSPCLILVGLHDRNVGVELCRDYASRIRDSKLVIFGDSAHFPHMEESEKYAIEIKIFVQDGVSGSIK